MNQDKYHPHPGIAAICSFIFSGLGQLYNGQIKKGLGIIFLSSLSIILVLLGALLLWQAIINFLLVKIFVLGLILFLLGIILICILGAYSIFDAYDYALKKNNG